MNELYERAQLSSDSFKASNKDFNIQETIAKVLTSSLFRANQKKLKLVASVKEES